MRGLVLAPLVCWLGVAAPAAALAQTTTPAPSPTPPAAVTAQEKPAPRRLRRRPPKQKPTLSRSLFDPTWRQFQIGGRVSSVSGDPARWQRYQDLRDGLLFTDVRYERERSRWRVAVPRGADNVGCRDQRYFADYERTGRFVITGLWDQIPQFYSVDTMTPYTGTGGTLVLDDATQRAIQNAQANAQRLRPAGAGSSNSASGATSAVSTWSRRRSRTSTSRPASRRRSTAASCPGAPASASATTSRWRSPTIRARTTSPSAPSGRTRATCCGSPTAAPGSRTSRRR